MLQNQKEPMSKISSVGENFIRSEGLHSFLPLFHARGGTRFRCGKRGVDDMNPGESLT